MHPLRISIVTYNIWAEERWEFRKDALREFMSRFDPDILCVQELRPSSRTLLDLVLAGHHRIEDDFQGWVRQSNIYWRAAQFSEIEHGAEEVDIRHEADRRLFWARLHVAALDRSILIATAHLTHQRHPDECATGHSPRVAQTRQIIAALRRLNRAGEPLFFMGDLNDPVHPTTLLHEAGYVSSFAALGLQPQPTFKCYPTARVAPGAAAMTQCIDWIVANAQARAVSTFVPQFFFNDAAPSDHWPVHAVYELPAGLTRADPDS
jgi:endonuclease/exonuclease/phosphatase family metal-dependent hydrolase